MLGSPEVTSYDLRFRLFDVPVRVNPWFWLVMLFISGESDNLAAAAVFIGAAFISILVHEFGHGLSSRQFGIEPTGIILYGMGGLCFYPREHDRPLHRLIVVLCGPGAGFALMGLVLLGARLAYGIAPGDALAVIGVGWGDPMEAIVRLPRPLGLRLAFVFLLEINFWWGVLNLLPIWPLDGGRVAQILIGKLNAYQATRWTHTVSLLTAGLIGAWLFSMGRYWMAVWFAIFGFINFQQLQAIHQSERYDNSRW